MKNTWWDECIQSTGFGLCQFQKSVLNPHKLTHSPQSESCRSWLLVASLETIGHNCTSLFCAGACKEGTGRCTCCTNMLLENVVAENVWCRSVYPLSLKSLDGILIPRGNYCKCITVIILFVILLLLSFCYPIPLLITEAVIEHLNRYRKPWFSDDTSGRFLARLSSSSRPVYFSTNPFYMFSLKIYIDRNIVLLIVLIQWLSQRYHHRVVRLWKGRDHYI